MFCSHTRPCSDITLTGPGIHYRYRYRYQREPSIPARYSDEALQAKQSGGIGSYVSTLGWSPWSHHHSCSSRIASSCPSHAAEIRARPKSEAPHSRSSRITSNWPPLWHRPGLGSGWMHPALAVVASFLAGLPSLHRPEPCPGHATLGAAVTLLVTFSAQCWPGQG